MNNEEPLYKPCLAAHTPQCLEKIAAAAIARLIILNTVPIQLKIWNSAHSDYSLLNCSLLDEVLLGTQNKELHLVLKERFKSMRRWWEDGHWFGGFGTPLRKLVQDCVTNLLQSYDKYSHSPLFSFTCQLCFTREAGVFHQNRNEVIIQVRKRHCDVYTDFLKEIGPFQVESLVSTCIIFGNYHILVAILKGSPFLRSIHLRCDIDNYGIVKVFRFCPNLERFVVEPCLGRVSFPQNVLYKTFFKGQCKDHVTKGGNRWVPVNVSFPKLTHFDLGRSNMDGFLCVLNKHYRCLKSLSCNSPNMTPNELIVVPIIGRDYDILRPYRIEDLSLTVNSLISLEEDVLSDYFPNVKHVTLSLDDFETHHALHVWDYQKRLSLLNLLKEKAKTFMMQCRVSSLTVHIPVDSLGNTELEDVLTSIFNSVGPSLESLQFLLMQTTDIQLIWSLVNSCRRSLKLLGFSLAEGTTFSRRRRYNTLSSPHPLNHLNTFTLRLEESTEVVSILAEIKIFLDNAPNVTFLELLVPTVAGTWVRDAAAEGLLMKVSTLVLGLGLDPYPDLDTSLDVDFYAVVLEGLTSLRRLVLIGVPDVVSSHLKEVYNTSQLEVIPGRKRTYAAYYGIHSKYELSINYSF